MTAGIWGYGVSIPRHRIAVEEINRVWKNLPFEAAKARKVRERAVLGPDEDTVTLSTDAAVKAIAMSGLDRGRIGALLLGTQTSPYHTRPAASILVDAIGLRNDVFAADIQFSGKSGTSALLMALAWVEGGLAEMAIAIGADTLSYHVSPGDSQEYVASSGACAVIVGRGPGLAEIEAAASYMTDTPDYFRLDGERYIRTGGTAMTATGVGIQEHVLGAWERLNRGTASDRKASRISPFSKRTERRPSRSAKSSALPTNRSRRESSPTISVIAVRHPPCSAWQRCWTELIRTRELR